MKKIITLTITLMLLICFSMVPAHADSGRNHTVEGVILGASIAILGTAILSEIGHDNDEGEYVEEEVEDHVQIVTVYKQGHGRKHYKQFRHHRPGKRGWVRPGFNRKWHPGHYNRRGVWISSRH